MSVQVHLCDTHKRSALRCYWPWPVACLGTNIHIDCLEELQVSIIGRNLASTPALAALWDWSTFLGLYSLSHQAGTRVGKSIGGHANLFTCVPSPKFVLQLGKSAKYGRRN